VRFEDLLLVDFELGRHGFPFEATALPQSHASAGPVSHRENRAIDGFFRI
jgi:hypothetical protein